MHLFKLVLLFISDMYSGVELLASISFIEEHDRPDYTYDVFQLENSGWTFGSSASQE